MAAYFNLNYNEISKELLVNKFKVDLCLMTKVSLCHTMNHRDLSLFRSIHWWYSVEKGVLKNFANFTGLELHWSLFLTKKPFCRRDSAFS